MLGVTRLSEIAHDLFAGNILGCEAILLLRSQLASSSKISEDASLNSAQVAVL